MNSHQRFSPINKPALCCADVFGACLAKRGRRKAWSICSCRCTSPASHPSCEAYMCKSLRIAGFLVNVFHGSCAEAVAAAAPRTAQPSASPQVPSEPDGILLPPRKRRRAGRTRWGPEDPAAEARPGLHSSKGMTAQVDIIWMLASCSADTCITLCMLLCRWQPQRRWQRGQASS